MKKSVTLIIVVMFILALGGVALASPMGTAFTYQGRLNFSDTPADGNYDFSFGLYDALAGGSQVGTTILVLNHEVNDGYFTVVLDFGIKIFTGEARWMAIGLRPNGVPMWTPLTPRQELTPSPYAIYTEGAGNSDKLDGYDASDFVSPAGDYGRVGVATNLYEANQSLTSKYLNEVGPDYMTGSTLGWVLDVENTGIGGAIDGSAPTGTGVRGTSFGPGGTGTDGVGVRGNAHGGQGTGVYGHAAGSNGKGVYGIAVDNGDFTNYGGQFEALGTYGYGVAGTADGDNGHGVHGYSSGANGFGVYGKSESYIAVKGEGKFDADGYLGVQGKNDFDGVDSADWFGKEIGVAGISTGGSDTDNYGVIGHSNGVGVRGEHSGDPDNNFGELGLSNTGVYAKGSDYAGYFEGDVHSTGEYTKAYTAGTSNPAAPVAYGSIASNGLTNSGTPNFTCVWDSTNSQYEITITGEDFHYANYVATITCVGSSVRIATTSSVSSKLLVKIFTTAGTKVQTPFHFMVYKP